MREANEADQELYEYVRDGLYPAQLAKAALDDVPVGGDSQSRAPLPFRYRLSRAYNNGVYKPLVKFRRRLSQKTLPVESANPLRIKAG